MSYVNKNSLIEITLVFFASGMKCSLWISRRLPSSNFIRA